MRLQAIFVDFGGVLLRTTDFGPRACQAERLGLPVRDLEKLVFESESSQKASVGEITEEQHWQAVTGALGLNRVEEGRFTDEFFSGDRENTALIDFLRSLRPQQKVGLISNAWSGLRGYITAHRFADVFDEMIISAEVGLVKPDPRIYRLALQKLGVPPEGSVFLDDVLVNVEASRSVGMSAIQFTQPEKALEELKLLLNNHR